ncbi:MAG: Nif3-like dinuclear metal center hexameric protein [Ignavibacteria bacterium]|nr:Nif3-like dinuclear metal center hexameric protein [Ignavibacteria bacterium]MBI3766013.1 Nif3-like dinuclear metal center hexameric protein [Ignavibacteriales bacterium]
MVVRDIQRMVESWAPKEIAWDRDNTGLQVGELERRVRSILITLDVTDEVISEAKRKRATLIISHHPLLFHPLKSVTRDERVGRLIGKLIRSGIALYSAHTNLDFTRGGVSFALAEQIGLHNIGFLMKSQRVQKKIVVFVPPNDVEKVLAAMAAAGAGQIGNYESCAFTSTGKGTFKPKGDARPYVGRVGIREEVEEVRLEMVAPTWKVERVVKAMQEAHPYEEVAYDVYDLTNVSDHYGVGAIGQLHRAVEGRKFLETVSRSLKTSVLRYRGNLNRKIRSVAVCGGSGSDLIPVAVQSGADAFVTADITYHRFEESDLRLLLVDAGHSETEYPVLRKLTQFLRKEIARRKESVQVFRSAVTSNPVHYYLS